MPDTGAVAMNREDAQRIAAYVRSPRHIVRFWGHVVCSVDVEAGYISLEDGTDRPLDACSTSAFTVLELRTTDWRKEGAS